MADKVIFFCIGWFLGSLIMWQYFGLSGLIRSREEWINYKEWKK